LLLGPHDHTPFLVSLVGLIWFKANKISIDIKQSMPRDVE
jgi:hypothetical protein